MKDPFKNQKLTPYEQSIEDSIDPDAIPETDPAVLAEVRVAMDRAAAKLREKRLRGGIRAGAGRKPKDTVPTSINLTPDSKAKLKKLAKNQPGGMSGVINRLITESP